MEVSEITEHISGRQKCKWRWVMVIFLIVQHGCARLLDVLVWDFVNWNQMTCMYLCIRNPKTKVSDAWDKYVMTLVFDLFLNR